MMLIQSGSRAFIPCQKRNNGRQIIARVPSTGFRIANKRIYAGNIVGVDALKLGGSFHRLVVGWEF